MQHCVFVFKKKCKSYFNLYYHIMWMTDLSFLVCKGKKDCAFGICVSVLSDCDDNLMATFACTSPLLPLGMTVCMNRSDCAKCSIVQVHHVLHFCRCVILCIRNTNWFVRISEKWERTEQVICCFLTVNRSKSKFQYPLNQEVILPNFFLLWFRLNNIACEQLQIHKSRMLQTRV